MKKYLSLLLCVMLTVGVCLGGVSMAAAEELTGTIHMVSGGTSSLGIVHCAG